MIDADNFSHKSMIFYHSNLRATSNLYLMPKIQEHYLLILSLMLYAKPVKITRKTSYVIIIL